MNRKLIRPNLAEVKNRESLSVKETVTENVMREKNNEKIPRNTGEQRNSRFHTESFADAGKRKIPPPPETFAETFYYKKQIDNRTLMVFILQDGEEIEGTIEWYDLNALKINRAGAPNIMLFKRNIKYMFKAEDEESEN